MIGGYLATMLRVVSIGNRDAIGFSYYLIVRVKDRKLDLFVIWNTEITYSETTTVDYQIDKGPIWSQSWYTDPGRTATFMPPDGVSETG